MGRNDERSAALAEVIRYFSDVNFCTELVATLRWPNGPVCPRCACVEYSYLTTRRLWKCKGCGKQYSVKLGTIFQDSALPLSKWLPAVWLAASPEKEISGHELGRALGVTQKSAWFMLHRIRLAMQTKSSLRLSGGVASDEKFIGGKSGRYWASFALLVYLVRTPLGLACLCGLTGFSY